MTETLFSAIKKLKASDIENAEEQIQVILKKKLKKMGGKTA